MMILVRVFLAIAIEVDTVGNCEFNSVVFDELMIFFRFQRLNNSAIQLMRLM